MANGKDLEMAIRNMLFMIAERGNDRVNIALDGNSSQLVELTRKDTAGRVVEQFVVWYHPSMKAHPISAYSGSDRSLLQFSPPGRCALLGDLQPTQEDVHAVDSFIRKIENRKRQCDGPVEVECSYAPRRTLFVLGYFAERMIPELTVTG